MARTTPPAVLPDGILDFDNYSAARNFQDALGRLVQITDYVAFLAYFHGQFIGPLPPVPPTRPVKKAHVNPGRWLWHCTGCNSFMLTKPGLSICVQCASDGWVDVEFPPNRVAIERELLKQPGRRDHAPIREWKDGQSLAFLKSRTARALAKMIAGENPVTSLSIGATRNWAVSEVLTAGNMNTFRSDVLADLAAATAKFKLKGPSKSTMGPASILTCPT